MQSVSIQELTAELVGLVGASPSISERAYSVFDSEDTTSYAGEVILPYCGIAWEGNGPKQPGINSSTGKPSTTRSAVIITAYFSISLAVGYTNAATEDTKPIATNLLDEIRSTVLGFKGVNNRPWRWTGDSPLPLELEGVILYGQTWETDFTQVGNTP